MNLKDNLDYKFNEGALIEELQAYIDDTYGGHYSKNNFQSTEFIALQKIVANLQCPCRPPTC